MTFHSPENKHLFGTRAQLTMLPRPGRLKILRVRVLMPMDGKGSALLRIDNGDELTLRVHDAQDFEPSVAFGAGNLFGRNRDVLRHIAGCY